MHWVMLMGAPPEGQGGQQGSFLPWLLMWGIIIFIFYFLMIRPQQKRQRETQKMLSSLKQGDRVLTQSGLYGTIVGMKDNIAVVKIADQVKVEMAKSAITAVVSKAKEA